MIQMKRSWEWDGSHSKISLYRFIEKRQKNNEKTIKFLNTKEGPVVAEGQDQSHQEGPMVVEGQDQSHNEKPSHS